MTKSGRPIKRPVGCRHHQMPAQHARGGTQDTNGHGLQQNNREDRRPSRAQRAQNGNLTSPFAHGVINRHGYRDPCDNQNQDRLGEEQTVDIANDGEQFANLVGGKCRLRVFAVIDLAIEREKRG